MIRFAPKDAVPSPATDAGETALFNAAIASGSPEKAHAIRAGFSGLYRRVEQAGQGHRLRDLMPLLHEAMRADMAAIIREGRDRRGWCDCNDLARAGYSDLVVTTFAALACNSAGAATQTPA